MAFRGLEAFGLAVWWLAKAAATLIIALTSCFVGLFGLTQAGEAVQKATWKTLDLSLSFLCALLLYFVVREITNLMVSDGMQVEEVAMKGLRTGR